VGGRFGFKIVAPNSANTNELLIINITNTIRSNSSSTISANNNSKVTTILSNVILQMPVTLVVY
jgi:hypothetical protein